MRFLSELDRITETWLASPPPATMTERELQMWSDIAFMLGMLTVMCAVPFVAAKDVE
jgi:hypothetical protein